MKLCSKSAAIVKKTQKNKYRSNNRQNYIKQFEDKNIKSI